MQARTALSIPETPVGCAIESLITSVLCRNPNAGVWHHQCNSCTRVLSSRQTLCFFTSCVMDCQADNAHERQMSAMMAQTPLA